MDLPMIFKGINQQLREVQLNQLLKSNIELSKYGLVLTVVELQQLLETRDNLLFNLGRVETGIEVTQRLLENFAASPFLNQENYLNILSELHEIFYYFKNELEEEFSDQLLLQMMQDWFNNSCTGATELLKSSLEEFTLKQRKELIKQDF